MCSLLVLSANKHAIYCTVKCFILTPYRFLVLWLLQVYPLKAIQTVNQNSTPFHSTGLYSPAGRHTAFIEAYGSDIHFCRREETTLYMWIYAFRQVAVCRQETPINRFYWCCLETDSRLHIYREQSSSPWGNREADPGQSYDQHIPSSHHHGHLNWLILPALIS